MELSTTMATEADFDAISELALEFSAYDSGNVQVWRSNDAVQIVAVARYDDHDLNGIAFFEVVREFQDRGIGAQAIRSLQAEKPELYISGDINSAACAKFWHRLGFPVDGCELANGKTWHAARD
jgi:hypothetical protein